jgi:hypothetical protein
MYTWMIDRIKAGNCLQEGFSVAIICSIAILIMIRYLVIRLTDSSAVKGGLPMQLKQIVKTMGISVLDTLQAIGTDILATILLP